MVSKDTDHKNYYTLITQGWMEINEIGYIELLVLLNVAIATPNTTWVISRCNNLLWLQPGFFLNTTIDPEYNLGLL